mmetsp:Transcript_2187/g.3640  ORF Transcript_2187/g.3640 Transcript_2187/m.3640 type:complete len:177 (-) Transcript_2187:161-691(-)|eukprot:CAMPEP_0184524392 /NCGR_PEP_ID=MMETSP0198_2-20121128/9486_1 /TAXON_ID=1112570 /ORGANISM="Thraustochytrium sp., Strain LLF1b" /LENGTH=176 /DNA_ID=CAMNT_0026915673 /DNA_START=83 /DNA_END=613 /DNA_ORIENTATION=+
MSAWKAFRGRKLNLLERTEALMKAKALRKPVWFDAVKANPPQPLPVGTWPPGKKIVIPEDQLLKAYYKKNPGSKSKQVFNLYDWSKKPPALVFVTRQLELMQKENLSEQSAYERVQNEFASQGTESGSVSTAAATESAKTPSASLKEQFEEWMTAEEEFWVSQAQMRKNREAKKKD